MKSINIYQKHPAESRAAAYETPKSSAHQQYRPPSTGIDFNVDEKSGPVQRKIIRYKPVKLESDEEKDGQRVAKVVDDAVQEAYDKVNGKSSNGDFDGASEGHINLFKKRLVEKKFSLAAAAAGYLIEDIACNKVKKDLGGKIELQNTSLMKGTRPDVVYNIDDDTKALIDITSVRQAGHIFKKKGNWIGHKNIPYVAESIYPTVNVSASSDAMSDLDHINIKEIILKNLKKQKADEKRRKAFLAKKKKKFKGVLRSMSK